MEIDWLACAREALAYFPISLNQIRLISKAENVSFYVEATNSDRYVLRIHRPEYHTLEELISEQLWTEALLDQGIDVPVVVRTKRSERYARIQVGDKLRNVGLLQWVDGKSLRELSSEAKDLDKLIMIYEDVGRLFAVLHEQASTWEPPPEFVRHAFDDEGLMGERPFWGRFWEASDFTDQQLDRLFLMRNKIYALLNQLPRNPNVYSLIHADLHTGNLISHGDRLHIIDFDDAGFGWHTYDFAVALSEIQDTERRKPLLDALFRGYERERHLEAWEKDLVPLFNVIRHLAHIGWIDARPDLTRDPTYKHRSYEYANNLLQDAVADAKTVISRMSHAKDSH